MDNQRTVAHLEKARAHEASAARLQTEEGGNDWAVVMQFYAALHIVTAYLATKQQRFDVKNHFERERAMNGLPELCPPKAKPLRVAYSRLKNVSEQVRYDEGFKAATQHIEAARSDLAKVHGFLNGKLQRALTPSS